jgi:propanol-preferring alcohol dehydrogenase
MRAAVVESGTVEIREVPRPAPGPEDALVELTAAGVCHSDLHLARGDWPGWGRADGPQPLGHEGVGTVVELGLQVLRRAGVFVSVGMPAADEGTLALSPLALVARER